MSGHTDYSTLSKHLKTHLEFQIDELKVAHENEISNAIERFKTKVLVMIAIMQLTASQDESDTLDILIDQINLF